MKNLVRNAFMMLATATLAAMLVIGYGELKARTVPAAPNVPAPVPTFAQPIAFAVENEVVSDVYDRVSPSVVNITVRIVSTSRRSSVVQQGTGSGFVIDTQGHILTNNHVVQNARQVDVTFSDGTKFPARVVGTDPDNGLALIKVDVPADKLVVAELGDSSTVRVGELAVAIGNPFGLTGTVTDGFISGKGRTLAADNGNQMRDLLQTDAAVNPGNSGGPLLNERGDVVGINSAIESPVQGSVGVGFAVPINTAKQSLAGMLAGEDVSASS